MREVFTGKYRSLGCVQCNYYLLFFLFAKPSALILAPRDWGHIESFPVKDACTELSNVLVTLLGVIPL